MNRDRKEHEGAGNRELWEDDIYGYIWNSIAWIPNSKVFVPPGGIKLYPTSRARPKYFSNHMTSNSNSKPKPLAKQIEQLKCTRHRVTNIVYLKIDQTRNAFDLAVPPSGSWSPNLESSSPSISCLGIFQYTFYRGSFVLRVFLPLPAGRLRCPLPACYPNHTDRREQPALRI